MFANKIGFDGTLEMLCLHDKNYRVCFLHRDCVFLYTKLTKFNGRFIALLVNRLHAIRKLASTL